MVDKTYARGDFRQIWQPPFAPGRTIAMPVDPLVVRLQGGNESLPLPAGRRHNDDAGGRREPTAGI